jgi:hypothetical protein
MAEQMTLKGTLTGHSGHVTQIATSARYPDVIVSSSRGKLKYFNFIRRNN